MGLRAGFVAGIAFALATAGAEAQRALDADEVVLEDAIAMEIIGRNVVAFDLEGSGQLVERLELDETVLFQAARGAASSKRRYARENGSNPSRPCRAWPPSSPRNAP